MTAVWPAPAAASRPASAADDTGTTVQLRPGIEGVPGAEQPSGTSDIEFGRTYRVTLVNGDVAVLHVAENGQQNAWVDKGSTPEPRIYELNGQVHVIPAEVQPYLDSGALDPRLFNVTLLVEQGYHDDATAELPLILVADDDSSSDGPSARNAAPAPPPGTQQEEELPSIGAVSVAADKDVIRRTWKSIRGKNPARLTAKDADLAEVGSVWLNGKVEAMLDESVDQIGAPEAWDAGYDGTGADVAVLDSGYDPEHPDLAGKVIAARDFTNSGDGDDDGLTAIDANGHGTHVAATIAGTGEASDGDRAGVAPGADLIVGRVLDARGSGTEDAIIAGMEWAVAEGADVVNMSLGTSRASDGTDLLSQAVDRLTESSGTLFVVAAGNSGPNERTVGSPGAATSALTVGAVTKNDEMADYSSRGPRVGDDVIKPEIVAPGSGIVAARAKNTSLGNLIDANYTSLNGTSMATPHVAGAAAILAQQHPEWSAEEIKARLISTSVPVDDEPMAAQGAGRLDVAAAVDETVRVDDAALSLGDVDGKGIVTKTLTFHNPTDRTVMLRLSAALTHQGSESKGLPELWFSRPILRIPAGESARTQVVAVAFWTDPGTYTGTITAADLRHRDTKIRMAVSFSKAAPMHTLTISGTDRNGDAAETFVDLWNVYTGESQRLFGWDGVVEAEVEQGVYTVVTELKNPDGAGSPPGSTIAGDPELTVDDDTELNYDARQAEPLQIKTERRAELNEYEIVWTRQVGHRSIWQHVDTGLMGDELSVLPGPEAETGTFTFGTAWQMVEPLMTAELTGPDGFELSPTPQLPEQSDPYVGEETLPIAYAQAGSLEELAAADVEGKVAVISRDDDIDLNQQVANAEAAGAAFVLAHNDRPGWWRESPWSTGFPNYIIDQATGEKLRDAIAADPAATLDVTALGDHTYTYELAFPVDGAVPAGTTYDTSELPMATVTSDYREPSDRIVRAEGWGAFVASADMVFPYLSITRHGPVERTEYVSTEHVAWNRFAQPHFFRNMYTTASPYEEYEAGESYERLWWGPLVRPGMPTQPGLEQYGMPVARFGDAIRVWIRHYLYDGTISGTIYEQMNDKSMVTLRRNGEVVGTSTWPQVQFTVPPDDGEFELTLDVVNGPDHFSDTSVRSETTWAFRSDHASEDGEPLPLVQVDYDVETDERNGVPAGSAYPLRIEPRYQPGATGPGGFEVRAEVSYDDGETWAGAPVTDDGDGVFNAAIPAADGEGYATTRVVAVDAQGNRLEQQIDRAWKVAPSD